MKITDVKPIKLKFFPKRPPRDGLAGIPSRDVFLVEVYTDEGITGIGESFALGSLESLEAIVEETLKPLVLNEDPLLIEKLWNKMYKQTFRYGRRGIVLAAISAIDIALWDIMGKVAQKPVYKLLGAAHNKLKAYASGGYYMDGKGLEELADEVRQYKGMGFSAVKIKVGGASLEEDIERVETARKALGPNIKLAIDANNAWDFNTALKMARVCEKLDIFFFEEPISSDDIHDSIRLADATDVPIAGYETELTRFGIKEFITRNAVDIVQADAIWTGGISEARKVGILAGTWGKPIIPHFSASAVSLAANLHFGASLANVEYFEYTLDENPLRDELSLIKIQVKDGYIYLPDKPGIGVELNQDIVKKYSV